MDLSPWKILIVDDQPEIHVLTKAVLKEVNFDGRSLEFLSAYNSTQTRRIVTKHRDIALILMDMVMDAEDAGLQLVRYIRDEINNQLTRIILLTNQSDEVPEHRIIIDYEINDCREKVNLTSNRLMASVVKSLRSYTDLVQIGELNRKLQRSRDGLAAVIGTSSRLFETRSRQEFFDQMVYQTGRILPSGSNVLIADGALKMVLEASGEWAAEIGSDPTSLIPTNILSKALVQPQGLAFCTEEDCIIARFTSAKDLGVVLIADGCSQNGEIDWECLDLFYNNAGIVYTNLSLEEDSLATQTEMIDLLGDVVENRSHELQGHVNRVGDYAIILAEKLDYSAEDIALIRDAAPMHDIGKIGIFDSILLKPGQLTSEEFEQMKRHTTIGYEILRYSSRKLFQMAATIALEHHERWDGTGYPRGKAGESIHELGRIICIVDVFDALSSERVYRRAWDFNKTVKFLEDCRGTLFDPRLVDLFLEDQERIKEILFRHTDKEE